MLLMFSMRFVPALPGLSASGMQVLGIFAGTLLLWLTICDRLAFYSFDWCACICTRTKDWLQILAGAYGGTIFCIFDVYLVVTYALSKTSYNQENCIIFLFILSWR